LRCRRDALGQCGYRGPKTVDRLLGRREALGGQRDQPGHGRRYLGECELGRDEARPPEDRRRHLVELTDAGAEQLAKAECALSAVEDEVLGALDDSQRETLYRLLQQAAAGTAVSCAAATGD
jgi:hypothetical protein